MGQVRLRTRNSTVTLATWSIRHDNADQEVEAEMPAKVGFVAIDTVDPNGLAPFWSALLGVRVDSEIGEGDSLLLTPTE
jgi:hypothetical protein